MKKLTCSLLSIIILLTISCEIGLGASVDTEPPSLSIDTSIADKVIRGDFDIRGTYSDDGVVESPNVVLKRTDGTGTTLFFSGELAEAPTKRGSGTWKISIPAESKSITDGTYQADITIKDGFGRTTIQSTIFTIDNTAPVIVLTRPTNNDTYGQKFTIEGQAADTNNIDRIEIQLFKDEACTIPAGEAPIVLKQVPLSISMDAASYESSAENYIYEGESADGKTKEFSISVPKDGTGAAFYCKIFAYDGASRYLGEDDTPAAGDDKGNKVDFFYLYKDIYTPILQYYKITELYSILSNTYKEEAARAVSSTTVKADLDKYQKKTSYFTLNPKNNPTFTLTGKSPLELDGNDFSNSANEILNGQSVFIEVSPGLDNIPLDEASLKIYVQECDASGKIKAGAPKIYPPAIKEEKGSSYRFNIKLQRSEDGTGLKINGCYIFGVEGYDQSDAKNKIEAAGKAYGFRLAASGNAPKLSISQPASSTAYVAKDGTQIFTGTIEVEMGTPKVLIYKETDANEPIEVEVDEANVEKTASGYKYSFTYSYNDFGNSYGIHNFIFKADVGGLLSQPTEKTIVYDVQSPTINITKVSPIEENILKFDTTKEDGTTVAGNYINGQMKFTVSITDDDAIDKAWYKINNEELKSITQPANETIPPIDTNNYPDGSTFTLTFIAKDRSGNESTLTKTYTIDQSTDKPVILPGDADTISFKLASKTAFDSQQAGKRKGIASTSTPVSIFLHDDDGIASLVVKRSQKINSDTDSLTWTSETITITNNKTQPSFRMPDDGGLYKFEIIATDIYGTQNSTGVFVLSAARDAATITEIRTTPTYRKGEAGQTFENEIIGINSQGPYKLYRKIEGKDTDFVEVTSGYDQLSQLPIKDTIDVELLLSNGNPISNPVYVYYYVEDSTPRDSNNNVKASLGIDNEPPAIEIKSPITGKTGTSALNEKTQFSGRASDTKSGVSKIWYKFTDSDSAGDEYGTTGGYTETPEAANGPFTIDIDFISGTSHQDGKLEEGSWYFHVYAEDEAGNKSAVASRAFDIDLSTPELEVTIPNTATCKQANGIYYFAGDLKGTIKDSDTAGPVSIDFKLAGTSVAHTISSVENSDGSFNWTVASSVFTESTQQNLKIIATDKFGKTKEVSYNVYKDNTPPNLTAINPGSVNTTTKNITGSVNDGTGAGVSVVQWSTSANGTYTNAGTSNQSSWSNEFTFAGEGTQNYYFKAVDILGNTSETPVYISFEYDLNNPQIRSTDTYSTTQATYTKNSFELKGKAWDTNKLAATGGVIIEENGTPVTGITIGDISNAKSEDTAAIWSKTFDLADGSYTYKMYAKDAANRQSTPITKTIVVDKIAPVIKITETDADLYINTNNYQFNGTITEANLNTLEAKLIKNGDTKTQTIYPANGEWSWTVTGLADAEYKIQLSATDKAGNSGSAASTKKVIVDTQAPVISLKSDGNLFDEEGNIVDADDELSKGSTYYAKTAFELKGNFTEQNFASATIKNGNADLSFTTGGTAASAWTYSQANTDGTYVYNISVTDKASNSASYSVRVIIDKAAPTTNTITAPVEGRTGENSLTDTTYIFKGNAADGTGETGLAKLLYKFSNSATAPEGTSDYDSMAASDGSWSLVKTINSGTSASATGNLYEGKWYLHVKAQDKAGNVSATAATREFHIDMASPVITTKLDGTELTESAEQKKNAAYTFSFKITETNLASGNLATITVKKGESDPIVYKIKQGSTEKTLDQLVADTEYTIEIPSAADAVYTYTIAVTDAVGKSSSITRVVRLDTTAPVIAVSTPDFTGWQSSNNFNVIGTASDASGTKAVYYALNPAGGTAPAIPSKENSLTPSSWTGWTAANGSDSWNISLTNVANGTANKLYLAAVDIMGNVTTAVEKTIKVDATEPVISDFKYAIANASSSPIINTVYLNRKEGNTLTIYGKYEDDLSLVDLGELKFAVSGETVTPTTLTFYSDSAYSTEINTSTTTKTQTAYWKAVFSKDLVEGNLSVSGYNGAGAVKTSSICTVSVDTDNPSASNIKLSDSYQQSEGSSYYINNTNKTFTISGRAADDSSAVKSVTLAITNTAVASDYDIKDDEGNVTTYGTKPADIIKNTYTGTATNWKFEGIDIKNWKKGATATITITDLAGNTNDDEVLHILFDSIAPSTTHKIDDSQKNLEFRIGDSKNDANEQDVGGKYSNGTYGSAITMQIRGNFPDNENGSGINKFYYKVFSDEVTIDSSKTNGYTANGKIYFKTLNDLKDHVIENKTDIFSPLVSVETKNVEYNIGPYTPETWVTVPTASIRFGGSATTSADASGKYKSNKKGYVQFRTSVDTNFKTTIKGFQEGKNYLVIVAEDNVGNAAVDSANVQGVEYPCYSLNVDITPPTIPTTDERSIYTNVIKKLAENDPNPDDTVMITGTVSDAPNKVTGTDNYIPYGSSGIKEIVFTSNQNSESVKLTGEDLHLTSEEIKQDPSPKTWTVNVRPLLAKNGTAIISAKVTDNAGFSTSLPVANITVDRTGPTVKINSPAANAVVAKTFTLSGTASDGNGAGLDISKKMSLYYTTSSTAGAAAPTSVPAANAVASDGWKTLSTDITAGESWSYSADLTDCISDGDNIDVYFSLSATDKSETTGNTSFSAPHKITVDRKAPTHGDLSITSYGKTVGTGNAAKIWYKSSFINIKLEDVDDDGTGVSKVEYTTDGGTNWYPMSGSGTTYTATVNCEKQGKNTISVKVTDVAGNEKSAGTLEPYVDTNEPSLDISKVKYLGDYEAVSELLINGSKEYYLQIEASDSGDSTPANNSGIASVTYFYKEASNNIVVTSPDDGNWIITVPVGIDPDVAEEEGTEPVNGINKYDSTKTNAIYAIITDNAGNEVKERILTVTKDSTPPKVEIVSFTRAGSKTNGIDDVNGTITISGTASDTNKFRNVKLEYLKDGATSWEEIATKTDNSWTVTFNTKELDDTKYTIRATATDEAGNTATDTQDVYVNQDSDRPVITVTNMTLSNTETSFLKRTSKLEGRVSDDDGNVQKLEYSTNGKNWTEAALEYGTAWSIADLPEGDNKLYFRVTDSVNTTPFETAVEVENATDEADNQPKIKDDSGTYVAHTQGSLALKFKVVTKQPDVEGKQYQVYNSSTRSWETRENLGTLGGVYTKFKISLKAKAEASIQAVKAKYATDDYNINFTCDDPNHSNNAYHTWHTDEINFDSSKTEVKIKVSDNSSTTDPMTLEQTITYSVDNTPPTINIKTPSSTAGVKETMQFSLSEAATSYYAVTRETVTADATTGAPSTEPIWTDILDTSNGLTRYIFFDNESTETDKTERFALYLTETSTNPKHLGITTLEAIERATNPYEDITPVKFWVKAVDSCGNIGYASTIVNVDPQGNRPTVTLTSPTNKVENGVSVPPTLGGTIRMDGNVADDEGAKFVWIQLERSWTKTTNNVTTDVSKPFNAEALKFLVQKGYTIGNMNDNSTVATATINGLADNADVSNYAIKVPVTGNSWNLSINGNQEFNEAAEVNIDFTIYATDFDTNADKPHRSAPVTQSIKIDSRTPYINTSDLVLVKYDENTEVARKTYKEGEDIDGIWYLQGMIKDDDSGIKTVEYKKNGAADYTKAIIAPATNVTPVDNVDSIGGDTHFYFKKVAHTDDSTKYDYMFSVPLGSSTANQVGTDTIQIHAVEKTDQNLETSPTFRVTYDNKAPVFNTDSNNAFVKLSQEVYNSSGFYTFGAIASEDKVNNVDQSGVERIAFYFTRDLEYSLSDLPDGANYTSHTGEKDSKTNDLFDVMIYRSGQDGADVTSGNMIVNYKGKAASPTLKFSEGLYWRTHAGTSDGKTFTYTGAADPNIHAGGLVKINGVIYKIKSVSGQIITVDNDITGTSADFALCNVIDNGGEKNGSSTSSSHGYGFGYYPSRVTDDGDLITESFNQQGSEWIFDASINSRNLPDGPITLHMVAFDKAGNVTTTPFTMNGTVKNNAPRIAGLIIGTDENGNGSVDPSEFVNTYSGKFTKGYDTAGNEIHDVTFPVVPDGGEQTHLLTVKGLTVVKPEIIGGNGAISYSYKVKTAGTWGTKVSGGALAKNGGGNVSGTTDDVVTGVITLPVSAFIGTTNGEDKELIPDGELSEFKFTFGDSTPGTSLEDTAGKNSASMSVFLDVHLRETTKAKNWILPFYWNSKTDNSLFKQSADEGHIELAKDWVLADGYDADEAEYDADPKVSGKIKIEGIARDDTLLREIKVKFGKLIGTEETPIFAKDKDKTIASYEKKGGTGDDKDDMVWKVTALENDGSINSTTGWASAVQRATYGELVQVGLINAAKVSDDASKVGTTIDGTKVEYLSTALVPETSQEFGHVVHWILYLDTAKVDGVAATDVTVTATATDRGTPTWNGTAATGNVKYTANKAEVTVTDDNSGFSGAVSADGTIADLTGKYRVDVVPYITGILRGGAMKPNTTTFIQYKTNRASSGAIPLLRNEIRNIVEGFNLDAPTGYTLSITLNTKADGTGTNYDMTSPAVATAGSKLSFTMPATAKDGYLTVALSKTANGSTTTLKSLNNLNKDSLAYNKENTENVSSTDNWTDTRYVRVWQSNTTDYFAGSTLPIYPSMAMGTGGTLYASWSNYSKSDVYYAAITSQTATQVYHGYDPPEETAISVAGTNKINVIYSANYHGGYPYNWTSNSSSAGGLYVWDTYAPSVNCSRQYNDALRFELFYHNQQLQQFKNLNIKRADTANDGIIHVAYYDTVTSSIHYSEAAGNYAPDDGTNYHELSWVNIDGKTDAQDDNFPNTLSSNRLTYTAGGGSENYYIRFDNYNYSLAAGQFEDTARTEATGESLSLALTRSNYPVIAYYDADNGVLKVARALSTTPKGGAATWKVQDVLSSTDPNYKTMVDYIACDIDSEGKLHIVFQNTKGQLCYIKSTNASANGATKYTFEQSVVVADSATNTNLTLRGTTPYISYLTRVNSFDGMNIAFWDSTLDLDCNGTAEGGWETMTAPLNYKVSNIKSCIEVHPSPATANWEAAVGFTPGDLYRVAYYVGNGSGH